MDMIERNNGQWSFAFTGSRGAIWHSKGQNLPDGASIETWIDAAGFNYHVSKVPAIASLNADAFDHIDPAKRFQETEWRFLAREDNGHILGVAKDSYQPVQPRDVAEWFDHYVAIDSRFHIDAAGVLQNGERLWMTARYDGDMVVAGDVHRPRLLMSTSFDATQATINQATMERAVCANTLRIAHSDKRAVIKTTHRSTFDGKRVARELAQIASTFDAYKAMGDSLAQVAMSRDSVVAFFGQVLDIPEGVKRGDAKAASTRKWNQLDDLAQAFGVTQRERATTQGDAWTALQAVTRYVDHNRSVRNADDDDIARFDSGTFGSGDALKGKALNLLLPLIDFRARELVTV